MKKEDLIKFEENIKKDYESGLIRNPIHLSGTGNEQELINIFKKIKKNDWVFSTHRNHYHALLKSNNPKWVKRAIYKSSMHVNSRKYRFFTSSIVGGCCSIALGVALGLKLKKSKSKVYCFIGDMAARMGIFRECYDYAEGFNLPVQYIIEDNGLGVQTPTQKVWGKRWKGDKTRIIRYRRKYPHHGAGMWVNF